MKQPMLPLWTQRGVKSADALERCVRVRQERSVRRVGIDLVSGTTMLRVINHTAYDVTVDDSRLHLTSAGESATLRIPTTRLSRIIRGWRHLSIPARQERFDNEKTPLIVDGPPRAKVYHKHVRLSSLLHTISPRVLIALPSFLDENPNDDPHHPCSTHRIPSLHSSR